MWNLSLLWIAFFALVIFDVIPHQTSSTPLVRHLRSPNTTPESHISNFLHQHRSDSRADKPVDHPVNASDPVHHAPAHPKTTTTEAPVSQTELLVSLIHNTIQTVREQFPSLISAISAPKEEPKPPTRSKKEHRRKEHHSNHNTHAHSMQERSANSTSQEEEMDGSGSGSQESGEGEEVIDENFPADNGSASLIPPALLKTILEASGSSSARGTAGASAGSAASASAGAASSSSNPSGRSARQADDENQGSASGEFIFAILRHKLQAIGSVLFAPFLSASTFVQRSIGSATTASGGGSVPGVSGVEPDDEHGHHAHHHNHDHHHSDSHDHRSDGSGHHSTGHAHHSSEHGHHSGEHGHHSGEHGANHQHNSTVDESANLIFGAGDPRDNSHKLYYRDASTNDSSTTQATNSTNTMITNDLLSQEAFNKDDGPLRIVLANGFLEYNDTSNGKNNIVRKKREARMFFDERIGIYILEFFGSIAGLTWGAVHQVTHLFQGRSDDDLEDFF